MSTNSNTTPKKKTVRLGVAEQRNVILEAAVDLFSADGSKTVSVSSICKAAGVSRDTYYRCFTDKEDLISFLYQTSVNEPMLAALSGKDVDFSNREWLHQATSKTIDAILKDHRYTRFLFVESGLPNSHAHKVINLAYEKVAARMQRWCKARYGDAPPRDLFKSLLVATQWLVHNAINKGLTDKEIAATKQSVERLLYGVFSNLEK